MFLCSIYGKIFIVIDNLDRFINELKYMAIDLEEVYIYLLVHKGGNSCGIFTGLLLNMHEQSYPMKSDSIRGFTEIFLLSSTQHFYTAFSLPGDLQDMISPFKKLNQPLSQFVNYPSNTISPVHWYHLLDWKLNDEKKQNWVRVGGIMLTMYGKQMSQYFQEPPAAVEILPLNANSDQQGGGWSWPRIL